MIRFSLTAVSSMVGSHGTQEGPRRTGGAIGMKTKRRTGRPSTKCEGRRPEGRTRPWRWSLGMLVFGCVAAGVAVGIKHAGQPPFVQPDQKVSAKPSPCTYAEICALPPGELAKCDIALMNLLCAEGLPGAQDLNVTNCLAQLDHFAEYIKSETLRNYHLFIERPQEFKSSEGYFQMMMMVTVLQQDLKIRYNPVLIQSPDIPPPADDTFFDNAQDIFIHGLIRDGGMGTCSSMPVFLVAVGRRLGYPLMLVKAKAHLFARWEQGEKSFNIEGTSIGFVSHPDSEYRKWPFPFTVGEEQTEGYLKSMTPAQELAVFLSSRGMCLRAHKDYRQAVGAFAQALYREPQSVGSQLLFARAEQEAYEAGVLPKRNDLQYAIRTLDIPPGSRQPEFAMRKAQIDVMNRNGGNVSDIEAERAALNAEMQSYARREQHRGPNEPQASLPALQPTPEQLQEVQIREQQ